MKPDSNPITVRPAYTPYDGSSTPFTIGLTQIAFNQWIEPDSDLDFYLSEKKRVLSEDFGEVFRAEEESLAAQEEVLTVLVDHLLTDHPEIYSRDGDVVRMGNHQVDVSDTGMPPLLRAGLLIADDLVLMRRKETGWHLSAAFLAFPSSWSLAEKFGQPLEGIHAQVPGFEGGSRNNALINRMFDNLPETRLVTRLNWSIKGDGRLPQPVSKHLDHDPATAAADAMMNFIRVERQTLRRFPVSGDILFTIHVHVDPLTTIARLPNGAALFENMAKQIEAMTAEELTYKGLTDVKDALCTFLRNQASQLA